MENVIDFNKHFFPVGSVAFHPNYKSCKIVQSNGINREIRYATFSDSDKKLIFNYVSVTLKELR